MADSKNLNDLTGYFQTGIGLNNESGYDFALKNYGNQDSRADVEVIFEGIEERLIELVAQSEVVVGCVAWLTNFNVLSAMKSCDFVNIVVQKEDYLRNDTTTSDSAWAQKLRAAYSSLRGKGYSMNIPDIFIHHPHFNRRVQQCCVRMDGVWTHHEETIRCIGYGQKDKNITPKMHHKFLVLCQADPDVDLVPFAVWTGSYNITQNAEKSRENALLIRSKKLAHSYLSEWAQLWALSESLDWQNPTPEKKVLYVGT